MLATGKRKHKKRFLYNIKSKYYLANFDIALDLFMFETLAVQRLIQNWSSRIISSRFLFIFKNILLFMISILHFWLRFFRTKMIVKVSTKIAHPFNFLNYIIGVDYPSIYYTYVNLTIWQTYSNILSTASINIYVTQHDFV